MIQDYVYNFINLFGPTKREAPPVEEIALSELMPFAYAGQQAFDNPEWSVWDGEKYWGGFGRTQQQHVDYWTLRARSEQLFTENLYARGLINRLVTNEINTGLTPEASPDEQILGLEEDSLLDWTELVENRFVLWGKLPVVCDYKHESTFGDLQRQARMEALISGDVLVVLRNNQQTKLPMVQLIKGSSVQTPWGGISDLKKDHEIRHGVEYDAFERVVAYHVRQKDGAFKRLPAYGEKSKRRLAWLVFGTQKRLDGVRGEPILSLVLQSLKEIDRYRDSAQRKAVVNSILAMWIKKGEEKLGTLPMTGAAVKRGSASVSDDTTEGTPRKFKFGQYIPGVIIDELQVGEEPVMKGGEGIDINFGAFEEAIIQAVAWANEIPPEILRLAFSNNYSASQAAINEFKIYLNKIWVDFGEQFCSPIYTPWLIGEVMLGKLSAPRLLEAWRNPAMHDVLAAWLSVDWYGAIKPSTDVVKQAKGSQILIQEGWSTNARESRITTGTKFSKNIKRLRRENEQKVAALQPLLELQEKLKGTQQQSVEAFEDKIIELVVDNKEAILNA